jgi:peroxiredoxin Q/BCP
MAQLRQGYDRFRERETQIVVVGPDDRDAFRTYWNEHNLPFVGLPDPKHTVLREYGQEFKILKLGRMPAQIIIDHSGRIRWVHYGHSMSDIPDNDELLGLLDNINSATAD